MISVFPNGITMQITASQMNIVSKRPSNEGLQEKASELFLVYYIAMTAHFHFGLLNHNSSPEFHHKNLASSVALLKRC